MTSGSRLADAAAVAAALALTASIVTVSLAGQRGAAPQAGPATPVARVNYQTQIAPLLAENCLDCHSQDKRKGGLSLANYADILEGGKDGPIVRPGNGAGSLIVHRLTGEVGEQMPREGVPLDAGEIALVRRWIDEGARLTPASAPAPPPWEAPLALSAPGIPALVWTGWSEPADRIVAAYLRSQRATAPALVSDATFARRAYLDLWGLLPPPEELAAFVADRSPTKRAVLVDRLLAADDRYTDHWITFWNDLLRNEDGANYYSEDNGRRSITTWLLAALRSNMPYDQFVRALIAPVPQRGPEGFLIGVNWRGETSAAVTPWMQASQNTAQLFLGINLKCNSCHDSFVSKWRLKDAYGLAGFFAPESRLRLYRCDVAQDEYAEPAFLFPDLNRTPASSSLADRRTAAADIFTDPRNGRLARTLVNRLWQRLLGRGIVANVDEMDGRPWSPALLDWLASDFVGHRYDLKHLIRTIVLSRAYQLPAVLRASDVSVASYVFTGPEVRRLTAEQFADAIGSITGEWSVTTLNVPAPAGTGAGRGAAGGPPPTDSATLGMRAREWRNASTNLTRALGRPIRDQVTSVRAVEPTTPQALELVNGEMLTRRLRLAAERMVGANTAPPTSLYNKAVAGRLARPVQFDIDITGASRLWLLVRDLGSNAPGEIRPVWAQTELVNAAGIATPLISLTPVDGSGLRAGTQPVTINNAEVAVLRVRNPSTVVYDVSGREFTRFRGVLWIENALAEVGATLDPQLRFFVFTSEPDSDWLRPPLPATSLPEPASVSTVAQAVDHVFGYALGRAPSAAERRAAERAIADPARPGRVSPEGLADLLWAVLMQPEFQFIY